MKTAREIGVKAAVVILAAAAIAYAGIPGRVSVLEAQYANIDKKLDQIIVIMSHRRN